MISRKVTAIGMDLENTQSSVAVFQYGKIEIIANEHGNRKTSSYVTSKVPVVDSAKNQMSMNTSNTAMGTKRVIGHRFDEMAVQSVMKHWPFDVYFEAGKPKIKVEYKGETKTKNPRKISSLILLKMKEIAETYLDETVTNAVITVPAYFNYDERQAIKVGVTQSGLKVKRIISDNTATAIDYCRDKKQLGERKFLVYDLGGVNLDISVVTVKDGIIKVKSVVGDTHLGGEDFDNRLINYYKRMFRRQYKRGLSGNKRSVRRLRTDCERAKGRLSSYNQTWIYVTSFYDGSDFYSSIYNITRGRFEELCADLFQSTLGSVEKSLKEALIDRTQIDEIVLVGGSTRIPKIQKLLENFFNVKKLNQRVNPDQTVLIGTIILNGDESKVLKCRCLFDGNPLSLGIETAGGIMTTLLNRITTIPYRKTKTFTVSNNDKPTVLIQLFEGERVMIEDNLLRGFELTAIPPAPKGVPHIKVTFDITDAINVSAVD